MYFIQIMSLDCCLYAAIFTVILGMHIRTVEETMMGLARILNSCQPFSQKSTQVTHNRLWIGLLYQNLRVQPRQTCSLGKMHLAHTYWMKVEV